MKIISTLILATAVVVAGGLGWLYLDLQKQVYKSQAVDGCMNIAKFIYEDKNSGTNSIMVIEDIYNKCLKLKEYNK